MTTGEKILLIVVSVFYLFYTLSFAIFFYRVSNLIFSRRLRLFHSIMIWIVPFFWIMILKAISRGTLLNKTKKIGRATSSSIHDTGWDIGIYHFFHGNSDSQSHDSWDFGGHESQQDHTNHGYGEHYGDSSDTGSGHH